MRPVSAIVSCAMWMCVVAMIGGCRCGADRADEASALSADEASVRSADEKIDEKVGEVVRILTDMPDWSALGVSDEYAVERRQIEEAVRRIAAYDLDTIRAAEQLYRSSPPMWLGGAAKLFVLNKFIFSLPQTVRRASPHFRLFGGWMGGPISGDPYDPRDTDEMDMRWPWEADASGEWRLVGRFSGFMGPTSDSLGEFDYYRQHFGKREIPKLGGD